MPEPVSRRGDAVTTSEFTGPFTTPIFPFGSGGIDLLHALDAIPSGNFARLTNWSDFTGNPRATTGRPGQAAFATAGTNIHSIARLNDPEHASFTRVWGVDGALYVGQSGALSGVDSGYSGNPLTFASARPPFSNTAWMYIGDTAKMAKVSPGGTIKEIGIGQPGLPPTLIVLPPENKQLTTFGETNWTPNAGVNDPDANGNPGQPTNVPPVPNGGVFQGFVTLGPFFNISTPYFVYWGLAKTADLSQFNPSHLASDDDLIAFDVTLNPAFGVDEIRLYICVGGAFSPSIIPGTDPTYNANFYMKAFRPGDFSTMMAPAGTAASTSELARVIAVRDQALQSLAAAQGFQAAAAQETIRKSNAFIAQFDPSLIQSLQLSATSGSPWKFGVLGNPLRRGDFQRFGSNTSFDWGSVVGIIVYAHFTGASAVVSGSPETPSFTLDNFTLFGAYGPDDTDATAQSYDYRYTNYDQTTGVEGNPSPVMPTTQFVDAMRAPIEVSPSAYGSDPDIRQRIYRRGGTLTADWYFVGTNLCNGCSFEDTATDLSIAEAPTLQINHFQPVPSVDDAGNFARSLVPVLLGPVNGQLLALGDPLRPGTVYASLPDQPDLWPDDLLTEVCAPSEELMNGAILGSQPYVFSRERGYAVYANLSGNNGLTSLPTECMRGLAARWAIVARYGRIWFVSRDGVYSTVGGSQSLVSLNLTPLFRGQTVNGYAPIDFTVEAAIRLEAFEQELWFGFQDTNGVRQVWIYQILDDQWRNYQFANGLSAIYEDQGGSGPAVLLLGGATTGKAYTHDGASDDGAAISWRLTTGSWDWGKPREEKLFGDQILDADQQGIALTWTNYVNTETVVNPAITLDAATGRQRVIITNFGVGPQIGRNLAFDIQGSSALGAPILYQAGTSLTVQPDLTVNRVTNWDDLGAPDPKYIFGVTFDVDTGGVDRTILIEYDLNGVVNLAATLTVNTMGRHKVAFTWPAVRAHQIRVRPNDDCLAWILYRADWIFDAEPPIIAGWDIHFEQQWDQYFTGVDLYCDTLGQPKQVQITVDGVVQDDPATGLAFYTVQTTGRQVVHLTLPWGRGHVFHLVALDANPGQLYEHRWQVQPEPSEQANWNQNFSILGTRADKYLKAVIFECDTFGQDKTVTVEADGVVVDTLTVNTNGRKVVQVALPNGQKLGRVFRFFPTDSHPGRLYSSQPVFDEEPFALTRWETQELDHGQVGFHTLVEAMVTLKSSADVTLTITTYINQTGGTATDVYTIPSTGGIKLKRFLPFGAVGVGARKGIQYKYVFTSPTAFWLYREESDVTIQPWNGGDPSIKHPFGDDDLDLTRSMTSAVGAAERSGGGTA